jgi:hypothetical protein
MPRGLTGLQPRTACLDGGKQLRRSVAAGDHRGSVAELTNTRAADDISARLRRSHPRAIHNSGRCDSRSHENKPDDRSATKSAASSPTRDFCYRCSQTSTSSHGLVSCGRRCSPSFVVAEVSPVGSADVWSSVWRIPGVKPRRPGRLLAVTRCLASCGRRGVTARALHRLPREP